MLRSMKTTKTILIGGIVVVAVLVGLLLSRQRQPPFFPPDATHARFINAETCLTCHGPGGSSQRDRNHPLGNECTRCHGRD